MTDCTYRTPDVDIPDNKVVTGSFTQRNHYCQHSTKPNNTDFWRVDEQNPCPTHRNYNNAEFIEWPVKRHTYGIGSSYWDCALPDRPFCELGERDDALFDAYFTGTSQSEGQTTKTLFCAYDVRKINTEAQMQELRNKNINLTQENEDRLMTSYCSQVQDSGCLLSADGSGRTMPKCSRFFQATPDGNRCRTWLNDVSRRRPGYANAIGTTVCRNSSPATEPLEECKCIDRSLDPLYTLLVDSLAANPGCWYWPCKNANRAWIPSDIDSTVCPDICETAVNIIADVEGDVDISNVTQTVDCDFGDLVQGSTYSCLGGHCIQADCKPGICAECDTNCFASQSECERTCQAAYESRYRCLDGLCQQVGCDLGEPNCYAYSNCGGACSSRYACVSGDCRLDQMGEHENQTLCQQKCPTTETSSGSDNLGLIIGIISLGVALVGFLVFAFLELGKK
uniref:Uncharacterized protein n=1 Tax=viral metagenome TaxID=1070528 RepID=A0A6C0BPI4_9ZZZZ